MPNRDTRPRSDYTSPGVSMEEVARRLNDEHHQAELDSWNDLDSWEWF